MEEQKYLPIEDYGIIGNQQTIALISTHGSIDFFCFPQFDSPTVFGKLLDHSKGGNFCVLPEMEECRYFQMYVPGTNVLLTRFLASEGMVEMMDFMPMNNATPTFSQIIRIVKVIRGNIQFSLSCDPKFNYGRSEGESHRENDHRMTFQPTDNNKTLLTLVSDQKLEKELQSCSSQFELAEKECAYFILTASHQEDVPEAIGDIGKYADKMMQDTIHFWKSWSGKMQYTGKWMNTMTRSALVLKLLTSSTHGISIAAATFGLPEEIGGVRNWDYRYTWIRDAAFTMYAFIRLGFREEASDFIHWVQNNLGKTVEHDRHLHLMYRINGDNKLVEEHLDHWEGYKGSSPVRVGNKASEQFQLDIYGELMDSIYLYDKYVEPVHYTFWVQISNMIDFVCDHWHEPDHGIWEVRGEKRQFLYSKVMSWVAIDRAIRLAEKRSFSYDWERWRKVRAEIYHEIYYNYWNDELQTFTQFKGSDTVDASALLMPLVRIISPNEPRWKKTLEAIEKELVTDTLVYRYHNRDGHDGLEGEEGTFTICSFWYVECLARAGEYDKAEIYLEKLMGHGNHLGLFAEQISLRGEHLGNYPQAFTHLGLISAAFFINRGRHYQDV